VANGFTPRVASLNKFSDWIKGSLINWCASPFLINQAKAVTVKSNISNDTILKIFSVNTVNRTILRDRTTVEYAQHCPLVGKKI